jgi:hypothetical protein
MHALFSRRRAAVFVAVAIIFSQLTAAAESPALSFLPAFPGAEGFGAGSVGGRGGRLIEVTNLDDHGPGSLRAAIEAEGPRIVIFRISGTIPLESELLVKNPNITIAGQTAPGDGICIRNYLLRIAADDCIGRYLRVRLGDEAGLPLSGIRIMDCSNVIVDHCSVSWTLDEGINTWHHTHNITIQWCLVGEALDDSKIRHGHGFAASLGGINTSYHHNLLVDNAGRNPSVAGNNSNHTVNMDYRNNVLFNWKNRSADGKPDSVNLINNYYKPGPATQNPALVAKIQQPADMPLGKWFIDGNYLEGQPQTSRDNWNGGVTGEPNQDVAIQGRADRAFDVALVTTSAAVDILQPVLQFAGATLPRRDAVDARLVQEVRTGKPTYGDGWPHSQTDVGGWPKLKSAEPPLDSDHDGMPDEWERKYGLNPNDPSDAQQDLNGDGYTNLEKYLNGIDPTKRVDYRAPENNKNVFDGVAK